MTLPHEHSPATTVRDVLLLVRRRKWLIMLGTAIGTSLSVALAMSSQPQYTATAAIVIEPSQAPVAGMSWGAPSITSDIHMVSTQLDIIRSRQQMARVLDDLKLLERPAFRTAVEEQFTDSATRIVRLVSAAAAWFPEMVTRTTAASGLPAMLVSSPAAMPGETAAVDDAGAAMWARQVHEAAIDAFNKRFGASQEADSRVISIRFTATDPALAADVVNRAAELYVQAQLTNKLSEVERISLWLSERIAVMGEEVRAAEAAVQSYRAEAGLTDEQRARSDQLELMELNRALGMARVDLLDLQSKKETIDRARGRGDTQALLGLVSSPILISLRERELELGRQEAELSSSFGSRHPRMQLLVEEKKQLSAKISQEAGRLALDLDRERSRAAEQVRQLESQIAAYKAQDYQRGGAEVGLRQLERQSEASRRIYELFLQRFKEIGEQQAIIEPDAQVISYANPPVRPSSLSPKIFSLLGFTASLGASALLALVAEGLDRRARSARQMERVTGLRVLGVVPRLRSSRAARPDRYLLERPISGYAEAMRSTYTALRFSDPEEAPRTVLVTSALGNEGKTTFALSLATAARQWGHRVMLVDADLRHPSVARAAGVRVEAGLVEVANGEVALADAIVTTENGLDILGIAEASRNLTGLMGNRKVQELFDKLRDSYELVVIDSPPVLAVTDARITAAQVDRTIFAVGWRQTPVSAVRRALQLLRDSRASMAGVVLLRVDARSYMYYENEDGANYYRKIKGYYVD
ncbi:GumC family protein [Marinimicrococcus flavescens]|uniref:non-specific protein-tyrosine kinase n=1 Tax=Marinimicrococcus flavescens TaxID=3031815 RepID=A0AAP3UZF5_9PROT|nr:AAA family ATPase [Marinimicrococcus flavescens]